MNTIQINSTGGEYRYRVHISDIQREKTDKRYPFYIFRRGIRISSNHFRYLEGKYRYNVHILDIEMGNTDIAYTF